MLVVSRNTMTSYILNSTVDDSAADYSSWRIVKVVKGTFGFRSRLLLDYYYF
jgi:hypothetical protein